MAKDNGPDSEKTPQRKAPQRRVPTPRGKTAPASPKATGSPKAPARSPQPSKSDEPVARGNGSARPKPAAPARGGGSAPEAKAPTAVPKPPAGGAPSAPVRPSEPARGPAPSRPTAARPTPAAPARPQGTPVRPRPSEAAPPKAEPKVARATAGQRGPRPAAGSRPGGTVDRPGRPKPPHAAAVDAAPEDEVVEEQPFRVGRRSNAPVVVVVCVVGALALGGGLWWTSQPGPPKETPVAKVDDSAERAAQLLQEAEAQLAAAEKYWTEHPTEYLQALTRFADVANRTSASTVKQKAQERYKAVEQARREEALATWERERDRAQALIDKNEFAEAVAVLEGVPEVMAYLSDAGKGEYRSMLEEAYVNRTAMADLTEYKFKAVAYAEQGLPEIAKPILEEFPKKYETDAERVWALKEQTLRDIENMQIAEWLGREKKQDQFVAAAKQERERLERERREQLWIERVDAIAWHNQIARDHRYNWVVSSDNNYEVDSWPRISEPKFQHRPGDDPMLAVNNDTGNELFTGIMANFWRDYIVEFELRLGAGTFAVSPRTNGQLSGGNGFIANVDRSQLIEFGPEQKFPTGQWVKVTIQVSGDTVTVSRSDQPEEKQTFQESSDFKLLSEGGFLFVAPDKTRAEIRRVRTKLITHSRERLF